MTHRLIPAIVNGHAPRTGWARVQDLPSIPKRFDDKWMLDGNSPVNDGHVSIVQENLNNCKR